MASIFTRIVNREIPAQILREDDDYLAFLDVRPIRPGHSLVIPKERSTKSPTSTFARRKRRTTRASPLWQTGSGPLSTGKRRVGGAAPAFPWSLNADR
jgi:hypothetical protein